MGKTWVWKWWKPQWQKNILRRWDVTKEKHLLFPRAWRSNRRESFDRELCKGQRTWGIPIMFLALTWLLKGESTILSIKSSTSSLRRYNMRCRVAMWDNSCLELSNELHKGMTKSRMCATRMDGDLMINHICEFISAKWTINFQWTTQGTKHSRLQFKL